MNMVTQQTRDLIVKTDYSGYFSVSLRPTSAVGLAVTLSETAFSEVAQGTVEQASLLSGGRASDLSVEPEFTPREKIPRAPRGIRGLTSYAKRLLVGAVNFLEQKYTKRNLVFHTATLPCDDSAIKLEALRKSKQILKYWRKVLSRLLAKLGLSCEDIVIVLEIQKRGAIHFHSIFPNFYRNGRFVISLAQLDRAWKQALTAVLPALKAVDFSKSCKTERVKKSAGRYLAKYLSKGLSVSKFGEINFSVTWYSIGDGLKQKLKALAKRAIATIRRDFDIVQLIQEITITKMAWKISIFLLDGKKLRSFFGFYDYRRLDFCDFLVNLIRQLNQQII
jgi:hypothetical protein